MTDCLLTPNGPPGFGMAPGGDLFKDTCGKGKNKYVSTFESGIRAGLAKIFSLPV